MPTILLVEDNEMIRELLARRLARKGLSVASAEDGETGLRMANSEAPDLILMDRGLPDIDGLDVTRRLKADERTRRIPVIVLTAGTTASDRSDALASGADDYDTKPVDLTRLLRKIEVLLASRL